MLKLIPAKVIGLTMSDASAKPSLANAGTAQDSAVQRTRTRHRDRLLALLHDSRPDAPPPLHAELLLSMIHATMRAQIARHESPP
jgi:hypothetical protein